MSVRARRPALAASAVVALTTMVALVAPSAPASQAAPDRTPPRDVPAEVAVDGTTAQAQPREPSPADVSIDGADLTAAWPAAGTAVVSVDGPEPAAAGALPVSVGAPSGDTVAAAPERVRVEVLDRAASARSGVDGLVLRLARADGGKAAASVGLTVDYGAFRHAFGGDWQHRVRLVRLDGAGVTVLPSRNDVAGGRLTADVTVDGTATFAVTAAASGAAGSYTATPLSPSGSWQVAGNSGTFSWSHGLELPGTPGGLEPDLSLSYSSGAVDGRTAGTNNQVSWVGEGWELWPGFVERGYRSCADDAGPATGDRCWAGENATVSFAGRSSELIRDTEDADGDGNRTEWRMRADDGTRVEQLTGAGNGDDDGEYWRLTTTDGTQYTFGATVDSAWTVPVFGNQAGEPCRAGSFAASACDQGWRWNLNHVVDRHGNLVVYTYTEETNRYAQNLGARTAAYTRGGHLRRVEYGHRVGQAGDPPARVTFDVAERCLSTPCAQTPADLPDVPWDQKCDAAPCGDRYAPTFFTSKRLTTITTEVRRDGGYLPVDSWALRHTFPATGDGTSPSLWLAGITRTGLAGGSIALPEVTFGGTALQNRVNSAADGLSPLMKYRLIRVHNETGGSVEVRYAPRTCDPAALPQAGRNEQRCFSVRWRPERGEPVDDWFEKYVVELVNVYDRVGGNPDQITTYEYAGPAGWRFDDHPAVPADRRTWSQWRGYEKVIVRTGGGASDPGTPRSAVQHVYHRGMHGDPLPGGGTRPASVTDSHGNEVADHDDLAGYLRETIVHDGADPADDPVVSSTVHLPWRGEPTATQGGRSARVVAEGSVRHRTPLAGGGSRTTRTDTTYDGQGIVTQVDDHGDTGTGGDERCTTTAYARNEQSWLLTLPSEQSAVSVACGQPVHRPADVISETRAYYDGGDQLGAPPGAGDATRVDQATAYQDGEAVFATTSRAGHDAYGRVTSATDALGRTTTTAYTDTRGLTTRTAVTSPDPDGAGPLAAHVTTADLDPGRGLPTSVVDANQRATTLKYDALGRVTEVRTPSSGSRAAATFSYHLSGSTATAVGTKRLNASRTYATSYTIYDGFLRERQTQTSAAGSGRVVTDTGYDSRGQVAVVNGGYWNDGGSPAPALLEVEDAAVPGQTVHRYDGAGRLVRTGFEQLGEELWHTSTGYDGERVAVDPPGGGTATTTISDARGRITELLQHHGDAPTGPADSTTYGYTPAGQLATVVGPAGDRWSYEYDLLGRRVGTDDPDKGVSSSTYDAAGQLLSTTDARGRTLSSDYDGLGRRVALRSGDTVLAEWEYDTLLKGRLTAGTRHHGDAEYVIEITGYDAGYRPTGRRVTLPAELPGLETSYETTRTFREDGSPATIRLPAAGGLAAETLTHGYAPNATALPRTLTGGLYAPGYVTETEYTAYGELGQVQLSGVSSPAPLAWLTREYEQGTRRLVRTVADREQAAGVEVADHWFSYDPAGNVTRIADLPAAGTADVQCFGHDHLRRMTEAWTPAVDDCTSPDARLGGPAPYRTEYTFDAAGNRTQETRHAIAGGDDTVRDYAYPVAGQSRPHAVQSVTTRGPAGTRTDAYGYDAAGNTTARPGQQLTWDDEGRLESVEAGDGETGFVYDADGARLLRLEPNATTLYLDGQEIRYDHRTRTSAGTRYYAHAGQQVAVRTKAGGLTWLAGDHHGTAGTAIDADDGTVTRRRYDPFGNPRGTTPAWPGERGFVGGTLDAGIGLTHLGAREYDPSIGRFVSVDPVIDVTDPQQMHGYAYGNHRPATLSDPTGLIPGASCPDGECAFGAPGGGHRPGQSPAARFNSPVTDTYYTYCPCTWKPPAKPKPAVKLIEQTDSRLNLNRGFLDDKPKPKPSTGGPNNAWEDLADIHDPLAAMAKGGETWWESLGDEARARLQDGKAASYVLKAIGGAGPVISFGEYRADGDRVTTALLKTATEEGITSSFKTLGIAIGVFGGPVGMGLGAFAGTLAGQQAGDAFVEDLTVFDPVGEYVETELLKPPPGSCPPPVWPRPPCG